MDLSPLDPAWTAGLPMSADADLAGSTLAAQVRVPEQPRARQNRRLRIGEMLVEHGVLTPDQLSEALRLQREIPAGRRRPRLGTVVVEAGLATERDVASALASALGYELVDLGATPLAPDVTRLLPRRVAERYLILPIARTASGGVRVACADPTNVVAFDDVRLYTGATDIEVTVSTESQLRDYVARAWSLSEDSSDVVTMLEELEPEAGELTDGGNEVDNAPTVRLVNVVFADAVRAGASDVHIEPQATEVRVRYRIDGLLRDVMTVPRSAAAGLVSRVKVMSNLDIAERRLPQDGRARLNVDGTLIDARVSTLPSVHGEKVVVRLLARADSVPALEQLGMDAQQLELLRGALAAPQGLVLITGPTGSGKTNTLYSALQQLRAPELNIVTLEDPVEIQVRGVTQVQVHERAGLTFARGLRSVLRQDPDVVLVGEVRDTETAALALEASLTGHLVLTTLHTNNAPAALTRLVEMGIEPFLVASSLSLVVAQRLVRLVCESCARPAMPSESVLTLLGLSGSDLHDATPRRGTGCADCGGTGYRGRTGIYELLPVTAGVRSVLVNTPTEAAVAAAARSAGLMTLRGSALAKARAGETTFDEVVRVTHVDAAGGLRCVTCERGLAEDMVACPWCGTPANRGHCHACARPLDPEWRMCPWCRTTAPADGPPSGFVGAPGRRRRLLVVDDDPSVRAYIATALTGTVEVDAVGSADAALTKARTGHYDAALVDNVLPDLSGTELVRRLRGEPRTAALPVMVLTGYHRDDVEAQARAAGADGYLAKPVEPLVLEERVLELMALRRDAATG